MLFHPRGAFGLAAAAMFLNMGFVSVASAQDVMQLDYMFRESLLRKTPPDQVQIDQGRRPQVGTVQEPIKAARRHPRRHRHKTG